MEWLALLITIILLAIVAFTVAGAAIQILWALLIGAIVGLIANGIVSLIQPSGGPRGCLETALAGVGGSLVATIFFGREGLIPAVLGAILVVIAWKAVTFSRHRGGR
ncbi:MAG TPA: hypothetical protein GX715_01180 [Armatimonadetes bacterium]|nr:hypothetical protein [Armatimonadota bacterium]